jgi:carboxypeptidase PM20D1
VAQRQVDPYFEGQLTRMADFIEEEFAVVLAGVSFERHERNLVLRWHGSQPELAPLLLLAHLDVVPVERDTLEDWTWPPFSGEIAGGAVWGRGALDDKSSALAILEACQELMQSGRAPRRSLVVCLGFDEEIGGARGAALQAGRFEDEGLAPYLILDEGLALLEGLVPGVSSPVAAVGVAEKGYATVELSVAGEGGHTSMPPRQSTLGILALALARLEAQPMPARYHGAASAFLRPLAGEMPFLQKLLVVNDWISAPLLEARLSENPGTDALLRSTTALTQASAGVADNVLPLRARARVNFRIHPSDSIAAVLEHVRRTVDDERVDLQLAEGAWEPSQLSATTGAPWQDLKRVIEASFPGALVAPSLVLGATDARHFAGLGAPIYRFSPMRLGAEDLARIHGSDERIAIRDYLAMIRFYLRLIEG